MNKRKLGDLLKEPYCTATIVFSTAFALLGGNVVEFDLETSIEEIESYFEIKLNRWVRSKLGAAIALHANNQFFLFAEPYSLTCKAFNDSDPMFDVMDPPSPYDLAWGVQEAVMMQPLSEDNRFSGEVSRFTGAVLSQYGLLKAPQILSFAEFPAIDTENISDLSEEAYIVRASDILNDIIDFLQRRLTVLKVQLDIFRNTMKTANDIKVPVA